MTWVFLNVMCWEATKLQHKINYSVGTWVITGRFAALPTETPAESDPHNKPMWKHVNLLFYTGELKGDKEEAERTLPQGLHMIIFFDGMCRQKNSAGGFYDLWA